MKKRQTILADNLSEKIIGLYGLGMSYRDISAHIKEMYDTEFPYRPEPDNRQYRPRCKGVAEQSLGAPLLHCMAGCHALQSESGREDHP
ncbi:hypothetical protein V1387_18160 [Allomuricauda taeanensis]|nr:hypothetical protein [Allomuricauda taeanensis]MEE1964617.1 hypothetical protein [Allomuricauda taeanensis]